MTPLQIALAGFVVFALVGLVAKIVIVRWMIKSGVPQPHDPETESP